MSPFARGFRAAGRIDPPAQAGTKLLSACLPHGWLGVDLVAEVGEDRAVDLAARHAAFESHDDAAVLDEQECGYFLDAEALGDVDVPVDIDGLEPEPLALMDVQPRDEPVHPAGRSGSR